jgi:hypothetical protein
MPRRAWHANTRAMIVIEGWRGKPMAELGTELPIREAQVAQGREPLRAHAPTALEVPAHPQKEARLERGNARLKPFRGNGSWREQKAPRCWPATAARPPGEARRGPAAAPPPAAQGRASVLG